MIKDHQLELLGLTNKESRLYLASLPLGQFTVSDIAAASGIKRPTCYVILDELLKKGLVSMIPHTKKVFYKAESPEVLVKQAKQNVNFIEKLVPSLSDLYDEGKNFPVVRFYSGQKGVRNIMDESLHGKDKLCYHIGPTKELVDVLGDEWMRDYIRRRVNYGLTVKSVRMRETEVMEGVYSDGKKWLRTIRYAPKSIHIPDTILIFGNKVAFLSTKRENFGLMIESKGVTQTMIGFFEALWQISSEK